MIRKLEFGVLGAEGQLKFGNRGKSRKNILDEIGLEKKAKFKSFAMWAKNKPTFLWSQDAAECFKKYENMEWIDWKEQNWLKKG